MKLFNLRVYELKILKVNVEIGFVEHILDAMMKPVGYLRILGGPIHNR